MATRRPQNSAKGASAAAKPAAPPGTRERPSRDRIAARAYDIWQSSGRPEGRDREHWLQAERELSGDGRSANR